MELKIVLQSQIIQIVTQQVKFLKKQTLNLKPQQLQLPLQAINQLKLRLKTEDNLLKLNLINLCNCKKSKVKRSQPK